MWNRNPTSVLIVRRRAQVEDKVRYNVNLSDKGLVVNIPI